MRVALPAKPRGAPTLLLALVLALAVAGGIGAALAPPTLMVGAIAAFAVLAVVATHPPAAAYVLIGATPLLAGLERDQVVPLLRPHELLGALVAAGLAVHIVVSVAARVTPRVGFRPGRVDLAIVLMAIAGSVVPLIVMLVREREIERLDLLYAAQLWKYLGVFWIVRMCIRTPGQVLACLWTALCAAAAVAAFALIQVVYVPVEEVRAAITTLTGFFEPDEANLAVRERGSSFLASPIAVGDVMAFSLAIAVGLLLARDRRAATLATLAALFVLGTLATGQFSAIIALGVALLALGSVTGRLGRLVLAAFPIALGGGILLRGVIEARVSGFDGGKALPESWQARLDNVTTYFLPPLQTDFNWLTGVRPLARIDGPRFSGIEHIWIESGYVFLLWTGGIALLLAFLWFLWVALRTVGRIARQTPGPIGAAAVASFTALCVNGVLMVLDPHLTLRGSADLSFSLLALALTGHAGRAAQKPG